MNGEQNDKEKFAFANCVLQKVCSNPVCQHVFLHEENTLYLYIMCGESR
jgi:hypothetical protein